MPAPRPLVVEVEWEQDGETRCEIYGPWVPAEDDSHLEGISRFVKGWPDKTGIFPSAVTLSLCLDPEEWLAGETVSAARIACPDPDNDRTTP
jgi:hypothetical protein